MANEIVLSPAHAGNAQVIAVEDECYRRVGLTTQAPTHTDEDIDEEFDTCEDCRAPCTCPFSSIGGGNYDGPQVLKIVGYNNTTFACDGCLDSNAAPWDGTFPERLSECEWAETLGPSFNGKDMNFAMVYLNHAECRWEVMIRCTDEEEPETIVVWKGVKRTGKSPLGKYTRTEGCAGAPADIEIGEVV